MISILHKSDAAIPTITIIHAVLWSPSAITEFSPGSSEQNNEHSALERSLTTVTVLCFKNIPVVKLVATKAGPGDPRRA